MNLFSQKREREDKPLACVLTPECNPGLLHITPPQQPWAQSQEFALTTARYGPTYSPNVSVEVWEI